MRLKKKQCLACFEMYSEKNLTNSIHNFDSNSIKYEGKCSKLNLKSFREHVFGLLAHSYVSEETTIKHIC